ncbi:MAG: rubredoxin, partial [Bacteroidota bacterium]
RYLVRSFDQNDISTYGLTFAIEQGPRPYFTSIVIRCNPLPIATRNFEFRPTYDVLYADRFDPNTLQYKVYAQDVDKIELPGLLMELCLQYWEQLEDPGQLSEVVEMREDTEKDSPVEVAQCQECLSVYDPRLGAPELDIPGGTPFLALPDSFCCAVCGAQKDSFRLIQLDVQSV